MTRSCTLTLRIATVRSARRQVYEPQYMSHVRAVLRPSVAVGDDHPEVSHQISLCYTTCDVHVARTLCEVRQRGVVRPYVQYRTTAQVAINYLNAFMRSCSASMASSKQEK